MADGGAVGARTLDTLVRFTMSAETANLVKSRFERLSRDGSPLSWLDCVLFDAALGVLGEEQEYYGHDDADWASLTEARSRADAEFGRIRVIDVTDTWRELAGGEG